MGEAAVYSVTQVNQYIKECLDCDGVLSHIFIRGEISNYKVYPSGHHYFSLKDRNGSIRCVMFRREAASLRFRPENGAQVIALGRVTVFPRDGQYQLYCSALSLDGVGDLYAAFERLKNTLYQEGLFDAEHKQPIPRYPRRIALITSPAGAAVRDMIRILGARWPLAEVRIVPVLVQGVEAPGELCAAIAWVNRYRAADLIVTGRGGGSMEDLWAFNSEDVVRTIYASDIPVISAVGHEPDVTLSDFVSDLRAATPSNAAELAVPDQHEICAELAQISHRMERAMERELNAARTALEQVGRSRVLKDPMNYVDEQRILLDDQRRRLAHGFSKCLSRERERFVRLGAGLDALSPLKVLGRGYAIPQTERGNVIRSVKEVSPGDALELRLSDGTLSCTVNG